MLGDEGTLLTSEEVAQKLRVTARQVQRLAEQGLIPCVRCGTRALRFDPTAVAAWVAAGGVADTHKAKRGA